MKIEQLLQAVSESKLNELDISPTGDPTIDKLRARYAQQDADAAAKASADQDAAVLRQQQAAKQQGTTPTTSQPTATAQPAPAGTTGDATLDQPLAPKKPGTTFAQKLGSFAKGVGAVAGAPAGIARAVKKGYEVGASAIGGPGAPTAVGTSAPSAATNAPQADQADELAQLRSQLQVMQQKLARNGIQQ